MSSPPHKRQRTASSALTAPFKSPVPRNGINSSSTQGELRRFSIAPPQTSSSSQPTNRLSHRAEGGSSATNGPDEVPRSQLSPGTRTISQPSTRSSTGPDPEVRALQRELVALTSQLAGLRDASDTATQALRLEAQPERDAELEGLVRVWRSAARSAAEELLHSAKDRINALGGLQAFRALETERFERRKEAFGEVGEAQDREDRDMDMDGDGRKEDPTPWMNGDEETLTMDLLLRSLGIEPEAIGFDSAEQRWVDGGEA